jgi:hypothetical protein
VWRWCLASDQPSESTWPHLLFLRRLCPLWGQRREGELLRSGWSSLGCQNVERLGDGMTLGPGQERIVLPWPSLASQGFSSYV